MRRTTQSVSDLFPTPTRFPSSVGQFVAVGEEFSMSEWRPGAESWQQYVTRRRREESEKEEKKARRKASKKAVVA